MPLRDHFRSPFSDTSSREELHAPRVQAFRALRRCGVLAWTSWFVSIGLLWSQHLVRVLHPPSVLFIFLVALTFGSGLVALAIGLWRVLRGPRRLAASAWLVVALLPVLGWTVLAGYAYRNGQEALVPRNPAMVLMMRAGHSLMEAQARYGYAHRLESPRLVMFYDDDLTDPEGDLRAMDQHVARMEALTGLPLKAKIYWARGPLLGQRGLCLFGIALASDSSPASGWDRHELAHALLNQHSTTATEPPTLLSEGWATYQSMDNEVEGLAANAVSIREILAQLAKAPGSEWKRLLAHRADQEELIRLLRAIHRPGGGTGSYLRELTNGFWYHHDRGPVYDVGGAFVSFLVRKYGARRFVAFYLACRPGTFEAEFRKAFGTEPDALEKAFWQDAEQLMGGLTQRVWQGKGFRNTAGETPKNAAMRPTCSRRSLRLPCSTSEIVEPAMPTPAANSVWLIPRASSRCASISASRAGSAG